jgi:hypothetical protein
MGEVHLLDGWASLAKLCQERGSPIIDLVFVEL